MVFGAFQMGFHSFFLQTFNPFHVSTEYPSAIPLPALTSSVPGLRLAPNTSAPNFCPAWTEELLPKI